MKNESDYNHVIKQITNYEDFSKVYKVYRLPPYSENWPEEKIKQEYDIITKTGIVFGYYIDKDCVGIVALKFKDHPLKFKESEKPIYLSDLAVLSKYRNLMVDLILVQYAINFAKMEGYSKIYLRTLKGSSSYESPVFRKVGFTKINDACQVVKHERTRRMKDEDLRFFWQYKIK